MAELMVPRREEGGAEAFRLPKYYYVVVGSTLAVLLFFAFLTYRFAEYFPWIRYPELHFFLLIGIAASQATLFILHEVLKKKLFFVIDRYLFIAFFFLILYAEAGVESLFVWILVFPLIVSVVDLDERATRQVGIIITAGLALFIFADPAYLADPVFVIKHVIRVILYGLIAFYMYKIVKETLRQKYEKEEAKRRFLELVELDRVKGDFLTVASHQLRTPLSGLRWGIDGLLEEGAVPGPSREIVLEMQKKTEKALSIVNDMLRAAESSLAGFTLERRSVDAADLVEEALGELLPLAGRKRVTVKFKKPPPALLSGDPRLLRTAFSQVIDNGIRYSPGGEVELSLRTDGDRVTLSVRDTGIGIPADDLPYVFERFYRAKNAISLEPNESGVGLFIAKKVIEMHHGDISVSSREGGGTTVSISLPVLEPAALGSANERRPV